jgi:hypothetical protein
VGRDQNQQLWRSFRGTPDDKVLRNRLILTYAPQRAEA